MQWLSENWIWIVLAIGLLLLMRRGGFGYGHHSYGRHGPHFHGNSGRLSSEEDNRPVDPVTGERVNEGAVNSTYQGRLYYFASRENRDKFEAAPAQYASEATGYRQEHRHRRHGC